MTANCLHPGIVRSKIMRHINPLIGLAVNLIAISTEKGARTSLYCATAPELEGVTGKYFDKEKEATPSKRTFDEDLAHRLWLLSEELTGMAEPATEIEK